MTYEQAIAYIETKTWSKTRLGLDRTRELLRRLGDPQKELRFVHVAGSNGKGSTCAMIASALQQAGYRTGLYTSPHLMSFCERFQVNGEWIDPRRLAEVTELVKGPAETMEDHPSQFELSTALAMVYFLQERCDIVVLEVGMGGELDSTNVIDAPEAAVIMNIGREHTEYLGDSLEEIARTKGGILKNGCDAVLYPNDPAVEEVIEALCRERDIPLHKTDLTQLEVLEETVRGQRFRWKGEEYALPLSGAHQRKNAATALTVLEVLRQRGWDIPAEAARSGLRNTRWPARMEILWEDPLFLLDGGHNVQCIQALAENLKTLFPEEKIAFLLGILGDKDYREMLALLRDPAGEAVCVTPPSDRALPAEALREEARALLDCPVTAASTLQQGLETVLASPLPVKVAVGSLYMAGDLRSGFPAALKKTFRQEGIRARDALAPEEREERSRAIARRIRSTPEYEKAEVILSYRAVRGEADLRELDRMAQQDGKTVLYPRCIDREEMEARRPQSEEAYTTGAFGIREPDPSRSELIAPEKIDLVLCPCTVFDPSGGRIGMGAGYYDRYLRRCGNASCVAVAFEAQKRPKVPMEPRDRPMDVVVTEKSIYR